MKAVMIVVLLLCLALTAAPAFCSEDGRLALSAKVGTLGPGLEAAINLTSHFDARVGVNAFEYDYDGTESNIKYDFNLTLMTVAGLIDWHPSADSGFRFTVGAMYNGNGLDLKGTPATTFDIGGTTYTSAEVGTLKGELDFENVAPYAGLGWGKPFGKRSNWSFNFDLGVLFQGSPKISYTADGTLATDATFRANLEKEKQDLEDQLEDFEYYPVIAFGITYRF